MKLTKIIAVILSLVLCLGVFAGCAGTGSSYTANNTEYVIGVSGPLTGGAAMYGKAVANSAQIAVDEINAAGGLNGVKFKLVAVDDMHDATKISTNYSSLLEGGMQISLGTVTTAPGLEFKNLSAEDNVFFLTPSASGDDIPTNANGYQMCFADGNQGKVAAEFVNANFSGQTIGVCYKSDEAYSKGIFDQFKANLDDSVTVIETSFTDANATDFATQIDTLKECGFIFMPTYYTPASLFMTQAKDVLADPPADQKEVNAAAETLNNGMASLELKIITNNTKLYKAILKAQGLCEDKYTEDSWAELEDALANAKKVNANRRATQKQIDDATNALNEAIDNLELKPVEPEEPSEPSHPGHPGGNVVGQIIGKWIGLIKKFFGGWGR